MKKKKKKEKEEGGGGGGQQQQHEQQEQQEEGIACYRQLFNCHNLSCLSQKQFACHKNSFPTQHFYTTIHGLDVAKSFCP